MDAHVNSPHRLKRVVAKAQFALTDADIYPTVFGTILTQRDPQKKEPSPLLSIGWASTAI